MPKLALPNDIGTGFMGRKNVIRQVGIWLKQKESLADIVQALVSAGYTRRKIGEYLALAEQNGVEAT
jgi:hypothetical protein